MISWRLSLARFAHDAFSGDGGLYYAGRWHAQGHPIVYTSQHLSLAVLEVLVHHSEHNSPDYVCVNAQFDESLIETIALSSLPENGLSIQEITQNLGTQWLVENRSAVLAVPSVVIPEENNYLLNPRNPLFSEISTSVIRPFNFDERLIHSP